MVGRCAKLRESYWTFYTIKKNVFVCIKCTHTAQKHGRENGGEAINSDGKEWINQTKLGNALWHSNIASRTQYFSSEYKRKRYEIQDCEDYQPCRMFLKEELAVTTMMDTRTTKAVEFIAKFKINQHDPILTKKKSISSKIVKAFPNKEIIKQFFVLNEKIDFYLPRHRSWWTCSFRLKWRRQNKKTKAIRRTS